MSGNHHLFAPSSAHRWMNCTAALAVARNYPDSTSYEAAEGTVAHSLASTCLQVGIDAHEAWQGVEYVTEDGHEIPVTDDMRIHVQTYLEYVRALGGGLEVEQKMEFSAEPDFGGTADALTWDIEGKTLHVTDLKYGKGIRVKAEENPQGMSYALLALERNKDVIDIDKIVIHIVQPRIDNFDKWETTPERLIAHARDVAKAIALNRTQMKLAKPEDSAYVPGDHCKFCPHAAHCIRLADRAITKAQTIFGPVEMVEQWVPQLTDAVLSTVLDQADFIDMWVAAVREEAMKRALNGTKFENYKLVPKRPTRQWTNEEQVKSLALDNMIDVYTPREVTSPAQVEKRIGKKMLASVFGHLIASVSSGLTLVHVSDKRAAMDPTTAAAEKAQQVFTAIE